MKKMNNTVLITGASAGIGKETAKTLIKEGYTVYTAARRLENMEDLKQLGAIPLKMDITRDEDVVSVVERIKQERGGVDILINNAGFATQGSVEETSIADARYQFEVNLFGLARLTQLVLPYMRSKNAGKIVNLTSAAGKVYVPLGAWYVGTKHALEGWSDCLRLEVSQFNIDVIIVEPGAIASEFNDVATEPMIQRSGKGPYRKMAQTLAKFNRELHAKPKANSSPTVIASTISKALEAKRPKTRYAAGAMAKPMLFVRKWGGDRVYDRIVNRLVS